MLAVCYSATTGLVVPFYLCPTCAIVILQKDLETLSSFVDSVTFALLCVLKEIVRVKFNELFCVLSK